MGKIYDAHRRQSILARINAGENIPKISKETGIPERTLRDWKKEQEKPVPKILIYDIETLPNRGFFFDCFSPNRAIPLAFIEQERAICTIAYKWLGEKTQVIKMTSPYNDKDILKAFLPIWEQATYTVAHYGDKFDRRFIAGRLIANKMPSLAPVNQLDTYKLAKRHFNLNSGKLDYLGTMLGVGNKNKTDASLWVRCANGNKKALNEMAAYNKQDVDLLEAVFMKLLPHVQSRMNLGLFHDMGCPHCGSDNRTYKGIQANTKSIRHRFKCNDCGAWSIS
jgi:DNA polymerase elongation subunit (family B)